MEQDFANETKLEDQDVAVIEARNEALKAIEEDVKNLSDVSNMLHEHVVQQGIKLDSIEHNIESADTVSVEVVDILHNINKRKKRERGLFWGMVTTVGLAAAAATTYLMVSKNGSITNSK